MLILSLPDMSQAFRRALPSGWHIIQIAALTFLAALAGLLLKPPSSGELSVLWPANALLVGLLLRSPGLAGRDTWIAAGLSLTVAGITWGHPPLQSLVQGLVNLAGACVAWRILASSKAASDLHSPRAIRLILLASTAAAATHAVAAVLFAPYLHPHTPWNSTLADWFFSQLLAYCAILPTILLLPRSVRRDRRRAPDRIRKRFRLENSAPLASLLIGLILCFQIGGPGTLAFPILPLLYCALVYRQHTTAWLTLFTTIVIMLGTTSGWIPLFEGMPLIKTGPWTMTMLWLGILPLVIAPLVMSSVLSARSQTISSLNLALAHDMLTGALSRQAFLRGARKCLKDSAASRGTGLLILDIDYFKLLNDTHGHAIGDLTLQAFARTINDTLRPHDLFGRLGGEEFGVALPNTTQTEAAAIAERLRTRVEDSETISAPGAAPIRITVSIGAVHTSQQPQATLDLLLAYADQAMYRAKRDGRNRIRFHDNQAVAIRHCHPT